VIQQKTERTHEALNRLVKAYENNEYPYNHVEVPQRAENLPDNIAGGGVDHARYLFFACNFMRGPIASEFALSQLKEVWEFDSRIFEPGQVESDGIVTFMRRVYWTLVHGELHYNLSNIPRIWTFNAHKLHGYWESDPRTLFEEVETYQDLVERIAGSKEEKQSLNTPWGFKGFGKKMVSMLAYFYMDAGIIDDSLIPAPIDFHLLRIITSCEILEFTDPPDNLFVESYLNTARKLVTGYCRKTGISMPKLAEAVWLLSRELCSQYPGNRMHEGKNRGRNTRLDPVDLRWNKSQREAFINSCGRCPIRKWCNKRVPSAPYYRWGQLIILGEREEPPENLVDLSHHREAKQGKLSLE